MSIDYRMGATVLVLAVICGCENPADNAAKATVSEAAPVEEAAVDSSASAVEALPLTPENTTIGFVGSKVTGSHDGGFKKFEGTFHLDPAQLAQSRLEAEIDMDSTWSDSEKLTGHLKNEDFFHVEEFPTSKFVSTKIEPLAEGGSEGTHTVTGNLTLHGVTKSISFPATLDVSDTKASLKSEFAINRKDFGIEYSGQSDNLIRDEVVIRLSIETPRGNEESGAEAA